MATVNGSTQASTTLLDVMLRELSAASQEKLLPKFETDPLALAVSLKRVGCNAEGSRALTKFPASSVTADDMILAQKIRDHYIKRYTFDILGGTRLTPYRQEALAILKMPVDAKFSSAQAGVFVKLPHFFEEDQLLKTFASEFNLTKERYRNQPTPPTVTLTLIKKIDSWRGKTKKVSYWFADADQYLYNFSINESTIFLDLFDQAIQKPITVDRLIEVVTLREICYNKLVKINFVKE
jgi:hypothetical protein